MRVASFMVSSRECVTASPWPLAYRFPSFHAIPKIAMAGISGKRSRNPGSNGGGIAMTRLPIWIAALGVSALGAGAANAQSMTLTTADIKEGATIANEQV